MEPTSLIKRDVDLKLIQSPIEIQRLRNEQNSEDIDYFGLGEICHADALHTVKDESELITRIENRDPDDWNVEIAAIEDELYENPDPIAQFLFGTSGLICTLSWLGCIVEDHRLAYQSLIGIIVRCSAQFVKFTQHEAAGEHFLLEIRWRNEGT